MRSQEVRCRRELLTDSAKKIHAVLASTARREERESGGDFEVPQLHASPSSGTLRRVAGGST